MECGAWEYSRPLLFCTQGLAHRLDRSPNGDRAVAVLQCEVRREDFVGRDPHEEKPAEKGRQAEPFLQRGDDLLQASYAPERHERADADSADRTEEQRRIQRIADVMVLFLQDAEGAV